MLDDEPELFTDRINVEISCRFGESHGVSLTTVIPIENFSTQPVAAKHKIRKIIDTFLDAIPVAKLSGLESTYADSREVTVGRDGQMTLTSHEMAKAIKEQNELRKKLDPEIKKDDEAQK